MTPDTPANSASAATFTQRFCSAQTPKANARRPVPVSSVLCMLANPLSA